MSIRLIASDLDGTLLTDKKEIAPYTKEALLFAVREKGCCFIRPQEELSRRSHRK